MAAARDQNGRRRASKWDTPSSNAAGSATEAAREAARKLNAKLAAEGKLTINATPPLLPPKPKFTIASSSGSVSTSSIVTEEIEINDSPRRLLLCQGNVQYEINRYSGAVVSTKGQYIDPSEKGKMIGQRPLYIFIQADSRDKVNLAVQRIRGIMQGDDPFAPPSHPGQASSLPSGMYYVQEKVFVGLDNAVPEFNLRERIVGPGESYLNHITKETGAKVHLRGRGSGFIEPTSGREAFEALYVYISHTNYAGLGAAKKLVENLIQTVHTAYQTFQMQQSSNSYYPNYGGYSGQNAGAPPHRPPNMYNMPPISSYGPPPSSGGPPPSYPSYPYPPLNRPPPQYNQHAQRGPNHNVPPNLQMPPPHAMYPNPALRQEGPRPLMSEQRPPHGDPRPLMQQPTSPYIPQYPTPPHTESTLQNYDALPVSDQRQSNSNDNELGSSKAEEKPVEPPKPVKRRFTEAPAKKATPAVQESVTVDKRSVSSLDQQSTQSHTPGGDVEKLSSMAPPVLPAPKLKSSGANVKKESMVLSGGFKMPVMPVSAVLAGSKKKLPAPQSKPAEKKQKIDESDSANKKTTGFALLGSYDDSSDED